MPRTDDERGDGDAADASRCDVCGLTESDPKLLQNCFECTSLFHLNPRADVEGTDCGDAWVGDTLGVEYFCQRCIDRMQQGATADQPPDAASALQQHLLSAIAPDLRPAAPPATPAAGRPPARPAGTPEPPPRPAAAAPAQALPAHRRLVSGPRRRRMRRSLAASPRRAAPSPPRGERGGRAALWSALATWMAILAGVWVGRASLMLPAGAQGIAGLLLAALTAVVVAIGYRRWARRAIAARRGARREDGR